MVCFKNREKVKQLIDVEISDQGGRKCVSKNAYNIFKKEILYEKMSTSCQKIKKGCLYSEEKESTNFN